MIQKSTSSCWLAAVVLIGVMWSSGLAQTSPGSPEYECGNSLQLSLFNCKPYLAGGNVTMPADSCCAGLTDLVRSSPTCLCGILTGNPSFSSINLTRASELPVKCGIRVDGGQCEGIGAPPPNPQSHPSTNPGIREPTDASSSMISIPSFILCSSVVFGSITIIGKLSSFQF